MMKRNITLLLLILAFNSNAQVFVNDQAQVFINNNALLFINNADLENEGTIENFGEIELIGSLVNNDMITTSNSNNSKISFTQNWVNNANFNSGISLVVLNGTNQNIGGTNTTNFYNLELQGNQYDEKSLGNNISVNSELSINSCVLNLNTFDINLKDESKPIIETGGYIQSSFGAHVTLDFTNGLNTFYHLPFGYNYGTLVKRKVVLAASPPGNYSFALIGNSPSLNGMDANLIEDSICRIYENHFWEAAGNQAFSSFFEIDNSELVFSRTSEWDGSQWKQTPQTQSINAIPFTHRTIEIDDLNSHFISLNSEKPFLSLEEDFTVFRSIKRDILSSSYVPLGSNISWTPDDQLDCANCIQPTFQSQYTDLLNLQITNDVCDVSDQILITVTEQNEQRFVNAFSPTLDNLNETFAPQLEDFESLVSIKIYNRWGEKIFEGTPEWDGKYKGEIVPKGVYVYEIYFRREYSENDTRNVRERGTLTVIR